MFGILLLAFICSLIPSSFQKINTTITKQYDKLVCDNEATCSWLSSYQLPEDRSTLKRRNCMCDAECRLYKDCCPDSPYYSEAEQRQPSEFVCPRIEKVYMKVRCAHSWHKDHVYDQCRKSIKALDSNNILVLVPVTNPETGVTYGNLYCAICNNDRNFQPWELHPMCAESSGRRTMSQNLAKPSKKANAGKNADKNRKHDRSGAAQPNRMQSFPVKSTVQGQTDALGILSQMVNKPIIVVNGEPNRNTLFQWTNQPRNQPNFDTEAPVQSDSDQNGDEQAAKPNVRFGGSGAQNRNNPFYWHQPLNPPPFFSKSRINGGYKPLQRGFESWTTEAPYLRSPIENEDLGLGGMGERPSFRPSGIGPQIIFNIFVNGNQNPAARESQAPELRAYLYGEPARRRRQSDVGLNFNKYAKETAKIWETAMFDPVTKQLRSKYQGRNFVCDFSVKVPPFLESLTRPCVPNLVDRCQNEADWDMAEVCRSHTMIVWNKNTKQAYRNKFCAVCNGELESDLAVCPPGGRTDLANMAKVARGGIGDEDPCSAPGASQKIAGCR